LSFIAWDFFLMGLNLIFVLFLPNMNSQILIKI
jgi:hypothetical protein